MAWRFVAQEKALRLARMDAWRHASYYSGLALGLEPPGRSGCSASGPGWSTASRTGGRTPWPSWLRSWAAPSYGTS